MSRIQTYKGLVFIGITALTLFFLIRRAEKALRHEHRSRQEVEERVMASEEKFSKAFYGNPNLMMLVNAETKTILDVNHAYVQRIGHTRNDIINVPGQLNHACVESGIGDLLQTAPRRDRSVEQEIVLKTKGGSEINALMFAHPLDVADKPLYIITLIDITERKAAALKVEESERKFRSLVKNVPGIVYRCKNDQNWTMLFVSDSIGEITGYPAADFAEGGLRTLQSIIHPEDREMVHESVQKALNEETSFALEYRFLNADGKVLWISERGRGVKDQDGQLMYLEGVVIDITQQKEAEQTLIESLQRYRVLYENASDGIFILKEGRFIDCNPQILTMFAATREEIIGKTPRQLSPPVQPDGTDSSMKERTKLQAALTGIPQRFEWRHLRLNGDSFDAEITLNDLKMSTGPCVQAIVRDISERKQAESRLQEYQDRLRSLGTELTLAEERERRRIATSLHDGACQSLALSNLKLQSMKATLAPEYQDAAGEVSQALEQVIQDLRDLTLDLSSPTLYAFGLEPAIEELLDLELRVNRGLTYTFHADEEYLPLPDDLRVLLYQAVRELVINAIKHGQGDRVDVSVLQEGPMIQVTLKDNGRGFDVDQARASISKEGGFGLFNIGERLRSIGGQLEIESAPGRGSRFVLTAPMPKSRLVI